MISAYLFFTCLVIAQTLFVHTTALYIGFCYNILAVIITLVGLDIFLLAFAIRFKWLVVTRIVGNSMYPTVHNGDLVLIETISKRFVHNDIVAAYSPDGDLLIKRVKGIENDVVSGRGDHLFVNGSIQEESFVIEDVSYDFGDVEVGKDSLCLLGDNRNNSTDSRCYGCFHTSDVAGRVILHMSVPN